MSFLVSVRRACVLLAMVGWLAACADAPRSSGAETATAVTPQSPYGSYLAARHAQIESDYRDAARFMDKALAANPDNLGLTRRTFVLRVSEGHIAAAVPLAKRLVDLEGNSGLAALVLLVEDIKAGNYPAAAMLAAAMPRQGAERYSLPLLSAWIEVGRHNVDAALKDLDAMGDLHGLEPLRDLHVALIEDYADYIDAAQANYRKTLAEQKPPTWRVISVAGNFFERHGRSEEARRLYQSFSAGTESNAAAGGLARIGKGVVPRRIVASPQDGAAQALFDLASLLNRSQTIDASLIYTRLALELQPHYGLAQLLAGEIREEQHRTADALALYRSIAPASPLYASGQLHAALALDALGRTDEAEHILKAMAAAAPKRPEALVALGDMRRSHRDFAAAVQAYDEALRRLGPAGQRNWEIYYSRGVALERSGQWPRAEADLKHALTLQPNQPLVLNYLGYSWIDRGENLTEALKMLQRAVALRPDDGFIVDSLGWAYFRLGDLPQASKLLERAITLVPEDATINDHLGDVYWRTGRLVEARYQWRRALQFGPDAGEAKTIEAKLDHGLAPVASAAKGN